MNHSATWTMPHPGPAPSQHRRQYQLHSGHRTVISNWHRPPSLTKFGTAAEERAAGWLSARLLTRRRVYLRSCLLHPGGPTCLFDVPNAMRSTRPSVTSARATAGRLQKPICPTLGQVPSPVPASTIPPRPGRPSAEYRLCSQAVMIGPPDKTSTTSSSSRLMSRVAIKR
ncbi:hypothetical protein BDV95DRAFT_317159 [Massariosphaeria phaeospora]|uniref:Uncharacterized protein n=1 Tax=Massariosphaeria phaeospora TaxID=100035 RepID=A0A7C8MAY3_9PLEO|nr:hypothetical protein BDV95DRAFT_317159 [Massariosphaeria phaeospora]